MLVVDNSSEGVVGNGPCFVGAFIVVVLGGVVVVVVCAVGLGVLFFGGRLSRGVGGVGVVVGWHDCGVEGYVEVY